MVKETIEQQNQPYHLHPFKHLSWTAIFVGALIALGLSFLLNLFGLAIGLSAFTVNKSGAFALAIGGLLGIFISVIVSMIAAGYAVGYIARTCCPRHNLGILYGFTTWSVALLLGALVATPLSHYTSSYASSMIGAKMMLAQSTADQTISGSATVPVSDEKVASTAVGVTTTPATLANVAFFIFLLFFLGALSTCFGACWAMSSQNPND